MDCERCSPPPRVMIRGYFSGSNYYQNSNNKVRNMKFCYRNGQYIFTACVLGVEQQFTSFKAGVEWVFTQKMAASVAASME